MEENANNIIKKGFIAEGTTCGSCEEIIKRQARKVEGVTDISFDCSTETGYVTYDKTKTNFDEILFKIEEKGYKCYILDEHAKSNSNNNIDWIFAFLGIIIVGFFLVSYSETFSLPQLNQNMGYGLLFLVGILTGFHCIAMCGGFVVGYTTKDAAEGRKSHKSHFFYGAGKVLSYTIIGAVFGLIGSIIAFTPMMRGIAGIIAGVFLILFGLRMLNIFPILRKFSFKSPKFINRLVGSKSNSSPLVIGLLNGLMIACGPLQAIYIMAAGTGSPIEGAKLLFIFGLGTLPVMLGFGFITSFFSSKLTHNILKFSGAVVIVLGLLMLNNGLVLTGAGLDFKTLITPVSAYQPIGNTGIQGGVPSNTQSNIAIQKEGYQEIRMDVTVGGYSPDTFVLKKGVPVKWIINGKELTSCNNAIQVPSYNLEFKIKSGEQTIEFTPKESGTIRWSCWMGMIPGTFIVKDNLDDAKSIQSDVQLATAATSAAKKGGCGCGMH